MLKRTDMIFQKKRILVMGLGITGIPVIRKLAGLGNDIIAFDNNTSLDRQDIFSAIGDLPAGRVDVILETEGRESGGLLDDVALIVTSPGIPSKNRLFSLADLKGIPVWDELELSGMLLSNRQRSNTIAVTGTNGKTTVVNLLGAILSDSGRDNRVCGNVGSPLLDTIIIDKDTARAKDDDIIRIVEVSSFQLERTQSFKPGTGVLLNITSDHIDRHKTIIEYADTKMKLFSCQGEDDFAILNSDDKMTALKMKDIQDRDEGPLLVRFGLGKKDGHSTWYENGLIRYDLPSGSGDINIRGARISGMHNMSNACAAAAAALLAGEKPDGIGKSIKGFRPLFHRMEYLGEIKGIRCINDSKSTNPDSIIAALNGFTKEVTIIMGGLDKKMDFRPVIPSLETSVNNIILIGRAAPGLGALFSQLAGNIAIYRCGSMEEAVRKGFRVTEKGDVLLLSPGCASMDMFRDYRERGDSFKTLVMGMQNGS